MKQLKLTFLLSMLMSMVGLRVSAYTCKIDGICYDLNSNNLMATVTYSGYPHNNEYTGAYGSSLAGKDVTIPSTISYNDEEYTVTAIGDNAFYDSESTVLMASITIPSTVTSIGCQAFEKCTNLTSITIPSSVTSIGSSAFSGCLGLTTIIIPNSVTNIGSSAFESTAWYNNKPDGMVYAGKVAYKYKGTMPDNTSIVIEEGTVSISPYAFHNCSGLTNVTIPNSVISIGETAFCGCSSLTSVTIPNGVTSINKIIFSGCSSLTSVNIPNSVITINEGAFQNCSSLTSITIPNSVTTIGKSAFSGTGIYANSPNGVFYVDKWACGYKGTMPSNTTISLQEETVGVASYAFYNYSNLTSVTISNSVTSIGDYAFQKCTGLASMIIPNSVTSIGIQAFYGCTGLTSFTIPNSVMTIGNYAFRGCSGLTSVTVPGSVMSIGSSIFQDCSSLTSITVSVTDISAFCNNTLFRSLSDSEKPFRLIDGEGNEIKELVIPDNVTGIGDWSFYCCLGLTSVTIPNSVTSIGSSAFWGCSGLTSVKVESETPLSIYYNTFYLAQANATLYVPKGSKAAYEAADYWREFKEIVEMPNQSVQFVDEAGNMKEDGSTITITEGEDDGWGGMMFPSGLYVQNTSDEDIYVGIDYDIKELPNGSFQLCFPQNCVNKTKTGASKTEVGLLQADAKRSIMAEWLPDVLGFGTCIVDFKVNTYTYNSSTKQYELQTEGPTVTAKMVYSDGGDTPQPSTNILSAYVPTLLLGKQATMRMNLANEDELIACEFDLQLPNGITIAKNEDGDPIATLSSRASKHSLAVSDKGNGLYHFLCYSNSNVAFSGNEGELLSIELLCDGNMAVGTYQTTVKNIIFSDVDKNKITPANYTFDLEVIEAEPGDVNNDGEINVMDVVEMVAYIMGDASEGFVFAAADLYPDGAINVMDLVNLVDLIMHPSSPANAREWAENGMLLSTMDDGVVAVKVNNPEQYVASEFIVEVSAGQTLEAVTADKHHRVTCSQLDDSHYKVMTYSSANNTFNSDALVQLHISGEGMVNVHDALLVDESRKGVAFAPAVGGYTTGINQMENGKLIIENSSVYDLQGKKRDTSRPYMHEVLIVNGKKQMVR